MTCDLINSMDVNGAEVAKIGCQAIPHPRLGLPPIMVSDHQSAVSLLEIARETVDDLDLGMILRKVLPILRRDLWIQWTRRGCLAPATTEGAYDA